MQDRNFNSSASNMIKLSVNEKMKYFASQDPRSSYSFYFDLNTAISRKVVEKYVPATTPKGNMGYDQYTVPDIVPVEPTFVAFL